MLCRYCGKSLDTDKHQNEDVPSEERKHDSLAFTHLGPKSDETNQGASRLRSRTVAALIVISLLIISSSVLFYMHTSAVKEAKAIFVADCSAAGQKFRKSFNDYDENLYYPFRIIYVDELSSLRFETDGALNAYKALILKSERYSAASQSLGVWSKLESSYIEYKEFQQKKFDVESSNPAKDLLYPLLRIGLGLNFDLSGMQNAQAVAKRADDLYKNYMEVYWNPGNEQKLNDARKQVVENSNALLKVCQDSQN